MVQNRDRRSYAASALSRRGALSGAAATALALAAVGIASTAAHAATLPDLAVIEAAAELERLVIADREAWHRHSEAEDATLMAQPAKPERREVPWLAEVDAMTWQERLAFLARPNGYAERVVAEDRRVSAALERHAEAVAAIEQRLGLPMLEREASQLADRVKAASARLAEMKATSPRAIAAKARVLIAALGDDWLTGSIALEDHAALVSSTLQDVARLGADGAA